MKLKLSNSITKMMIVSSALLSCSAIASDQWGMYQANASHTGYIPITLNSGDISFRWKKQVSSAALSPVTAAKGYLFVSDPGYFGTQHLYAMNKNGKLMWGKSFSNIFSINPPSYADDKVYIQTVNNAGDTYLRAYDAKTGNFVFQSLHGAQWERYLAPTIYQGTVYVDGGAYGGMYSFDGKSGHENWFYNGLPQAAGWTPAVDEKWAYTYIGTLYAVDRLTGKLAFSIVNTGQQAVPMLGGLNDVFVVDGGMLSKFNTNTQKIAWQKTYNFGEDYVGQPALANNVVYVGTTQGSLVALDQNTGKTLWAWKNTVKDSVINNIVVTKSHAFFATANKVYGIDLKTHQNVWSYSTSGHLTLAESTLYVAGNNGMLTAFRLGIADILVSSNITFKPTVVNTISTKNIAIKNVGDKALTISAINSESSVFTTKIDTPFVIAPNQTKLVAVSFTPTTAGIVEANLIVKSDDENESEIRISLKGKGVSL